MDASQAFYRYLSRTLVRPQCQNVLQSSRSQLTRPHPRRKNAIRTFCSSQTQHKAEEESSRPPTSAKNPAPPSAQDQPRPARSFRRQSTNSTGFVSRFESPPPPSFSPPITTDETTDYPTKDLPPNPETARSNIASMLDTAFGVRDIIPPKRRSAKAPTATQSDDSDKFYDTLSAYESKKAPRPLTKPASSEENIGKAWFTGYDTEELAREHEKGVRMRLGPTLGRTVAVNLNRNVDLNRAFRMLEIKNQANKVKADEREQRFHVRKGQMRKIMRRRRWRVTFMAGFLEECKRVRRMRKQGW